MHQNHMGRGHAEFVKIKVSSFQIKKPKIASTHVPLSPRVTAFPEGEAPSVLPT